MRTVEKKANELREIQNKKKKEKRKRVVETSSKNGLSKRKRANETHDRLKGREHTQK